MKFKSYKASSSAAITLIRRCSAVMACIVIAAPAMGAMLEGSKPKDWAANPKKHQVAIRREAANEKQAALITAAESAPINDPAAKTPAAVKRWWHEEQLGIRIPFALTGDAVTYYKNLVEQYGKQAFNRYMEPSSQFEYFASVKFHQEYKLGDQTFKDVNVVTLKLKFSEHFAATQTEGMNFEKQRIVVLDALGKVVLVSGDGPTEVMIMAI